ncbi:MAG: hypothetical protein IJX67_08350 [Oscillospiraceae bacterium]|nr:hypothetical protein [Oscillospiraceae bacterium]
MKAKTRFRSRLMSLLLVTLLAFSMLPTAALAADTSEEHIHTEDCAHEEIAVETEPVTVDTSAVEADPVTEITVETEDVTITETEPVTEEIPAQEAEYSLEWEIVEYGTMKITGSGSIPAFTSADDQPWKDRRSEIILVLFDETTEMEITSLEHWFTGCENLMYIAVPGCVAEYDDNHFTDCTKLGIVLYDNQILRGATLLQGDNSTAEASGGIALFAARAGCGITRCTCTSACSYTYINYRVAPESNDYHIMNPACADCGMTDGIVSSGDHTFSGNTCTLCGYTTSSGGDTGGGTTTCYHYSSYYSWSGCTYYEYCSNCGEYLGSGTSHGSTYTSWSGCNWYEYCYDCDELMDYGTSHGTYSYGAWEYYNSSRHRRYYSCNDCGEGSYSYGYHSTTTKYTEYSSTQHKYGSYCSTCSSYVGSTSYASHSFSYGSWSNYSSTQHRRTVSCSACGYSSYEYASHSLTYGSWTSYNGTQHRRTVKCSTCSYSSYEYANHSLTTGNWTSVSDTQHSRTTSCSCGYSTTETASHSLNYGTWGSYNDDQHRRSVNCDCGYSSYEYEDHSLSAGEIASTGNANQHEREMSCDCGYVTSVSENHTFTYGAWEDYDDTQHRRTAECDCGYSGYDYAIHIYIYADSLEQKDDVQHYMIHKCEECTHSVKEQENHSFTYGNWEAATESEHSRTVSCRCGYTGEETALHEDLNGDDYCDDCGYLVTRFSVTLPAAMVMTVSEDGEIHTADNVVIINNSTHAVEITSVTVTAAGDWTLVPYHYNMAAAKVDTKLIGFSLNGAVTTQTGDTERLSLPTNWTIDRADTFPLEYDAIVSATSTTMENEQVLTLVFVIDWAPR